MVKTENYIGIYRSRNGGLPIHVMLRNTGALSQGHDVMGVGYAVSLSGDDYLAVFDGWYMAIRFVDFDYYPLIKGLSVWVSTSL